MERGVRMPLKSSRGRPRDELGVFVVTDCEADDTLVHTVVGHQKILKNEAEYPGEGTDRDDPERIGGDQVFYVDEPPILGGEGKHPQPLTYIAGGIGA